MSRIDSNSAFDTRAKNASEKVVDHLREQKREDVREQRTTAQQMINNLVRPNSRDTSARTPEATTPQHQEQPGTQVHADRPTAPRQEVSQEGSRVAAQQQAFQEAGAASRNLNQLSANRVQPQSSSRPATQEAVVSKNQAPDANIQQQNPQASTFTLSQAMGRVPHTQTKAGAEAATRFIDPSNNARVSRDRTQQTTENQPQQVVQQGTPTATAQAARGPSNPGQADLHCQDGATRETRDDGGEEPIASRQTQRSSSGARSGRAGIVYSNAESNRLQDLMTGTGTGEGDTEDSGSQTQEVSAPVISGPIPETDQATVVFNEFDSEREGIETVIARSNIYKQFVLKERLREIATFNESLDQQFKAIFGTPFSERVEGDLIKASDCLRNIRG